MRRSAGGAFSLWWDRSHAGIALAAFLAVGCGAASSTTPAYAETEPPPDPATVAPTEPPARQGTITRPELQAVLEGGLGRFLSMVETEPHLDDGSFVGFRLTALHAPYLSGVDLRPGDTLLTVNGMSIERPEQALSVFSGLLVASELTIEYLRDGEPQQLRFAIED